MNDILSKFSENNVLMTHKYEYQNHDIGELSITQLDWKTLIFSVKISIFCIDLRNTKMP